MPVNCFCGQPAASYVVKSGKNEGRTFFKCYASATGDRLCSSYSFAEDVEKNKDAGTGNLTGYILAENKRRRTTAPTAPTAATDGVIADLQRRVHELEMSNTQIRSAMELMRQ